jgi:hypothetical protein
MNMTVKSAYAYDVHFLVVEVGLPQRYEEKKWTETHDVENQKLGVHERSYDTVKELHDELRAF